MQPDPHQITPAARQRLAWPSFINPLRARPPVARLLWLVAAILLLVASVLPPGAPSEAAAQAMDPRTFTQTGFRIDRDAFWDYFRARGGVAMFGYPVSRDFLFLGCTVQFFQREGLQQCGTGAVGLLNLLDADLFPFTQVNGSTFPAEDPALKAITPSPNAPNYGSTMLDFLRDNVPEQFNGQPVRFYTTLLGASGDDHKDDDPVIRALLGLEMWGAPISRPTPDPNNANFIYQRFQRGIMHYDKSCGCTQGLLLADYLKAVLTGVNLPDDLRAQARSSPLYLSAAVDAAPSGTVYGNAFVPIGSSAPTATPTATRIAATPTATLKPTSARPTSPDYGMNMFTWGRPDTTERDLELASSAGFHWQRMLLQWRLIEGQCKGCFDWSNTDAAIQASNEAGLKVLARLDFQPAWTGSPITFNGPPRNYQDYWDFVAAVANRYKFGSEHGHIDAIEVWNEVNLRREWGNQAINPQSAVDYVNLLSGAYRAIKAADPTILVLTAGLAPTGVTDNSSADDLLYLAWMFDAGLKGGVNYDVLGAHSLAQAPDVDTPVDNLPGVPTPGYYFPHASSYFRRIEQLRALQVSRGDGDRQIWLTEFGWTSDEIHDGYTWFAVSEIKKADSLMRAYQYARQHWQPWIGVMAVWTMSDPWWTPDREEWWWAITNPDGSVRPAYNVLKNARSNGALPN